MLLITFSLSLSVAGSVPARGIIEGRQLMQDGRQAGNAEAGSAVVVAEPAQNRIRDHRPSVQHPRVRSRGYLLPDPLLRSRLIVMRIEKQAVVAGEHAPRSLRIPASSMIRFRAHASPCNVWSARASCRDTMACTYPWSCMCPGNTRRHVHKGSLMAGKTRTTERSGTRPCRRRTVHYCSSQCHRRYSRLRCGSR